MSASKRQMIWWLARRQGGRCRGCGRLFRRLGPTEGVPEFRTFPTLDHIEPRSKGGSDHVDNLQALCRRCNGRKSSRTATDNLLFLGDYL